MHRHEEPAQSRQTNNNSGSHLQAVDSGDLHSMSWETELEEGAQERARARRRPQAFLFIFPKFGSLTALRHVGLTQQLLWPFTSPVVKGRSQVGQVVGALRLGERKPHLQISAVVSPPWCTASLGHSPGNPHRFSAQLGLKASASGVRLHLRPQADSRSPSPSGLKNRAPNPESRERQGCNAGWARRA